MKKNLLKKVLAMTVTVAMLGGLVACGSASNESSAEPAPASSEAAQTTAEEALPEKLRMRLHRPRIQE